SANSTTNRRDMSCAAACESYSSDVISVSTERFLGATTWARSFDRGAAQPPPWIEGLQRRREPADMRRNHVTQLLEREMARVEQIEIDFLQIVLVGVRAGCGEDDVVLAPDDEGRRLVLAEIGVPLRVP